MYVYTYAYTRYSLLLRLTVSLQYLNLGAIPFIHFQCSHSICHKVHPWSAGELCHHSICQAGSWGRASWKGLASQEASH